MDTCDESGFKCICKDGYIGTYCEKEQGLLIRLLKSFIRTSAINVQVSHVQEMKYKEDGEENTSLGENYHHRGE